MCNCVEKVNESLKEQDNPRVINTKIKQSFQMDFEEGEMKATPPEIRTEKVNDSGPEPVPMFVTYCPFCGEKWESES